VQVVEELGHKPAHLVDSPLDIDNTWFEGVDRVGVTSGASTPTWMTRKVIEHLEKLGEGEPVAAG
jgi:4-hydroxy-3-methylbut-2-enyl diphosphate reductase